MSPPLAQHRSFELDQVPDHVDRESRRTQPETRCAGTLGVASHGCPMPGLAHRAQSPASIHETNSQGHQAKGPRGAIVEDVLECISAPTPDHARLNIQAMGAVLHHRCPCRGKRQGLSRAPIRLVEQAQYTSKSNQQPSKIMQV